MSFLRSGIVTWFAESPSFVLILSCPTGLTFLVAFGPLTHDHLHFDYQSKSERLAQTLSIVAVPSEFDERWRACG